MENTIIYSYSDSEAIEDGLLVDFSSFGLSFCGLPVNRITGNLLGNILELTKSASNKDEETSYIKDIIKMILLVSSNPEDDYLFTSYHDDLGTVWIVRNEVSGYTLMKPEDY